MATQKPGSPTPPNLPADVSNADATDEKRRQKPIRFLGSSLSAIKAFPRAVQREAGFQLYRVEQGLEPQDTKPMPIIGPGVQELRIRDEAGAFRVIYLATRPEAVYVLHAFQKKTQATAKRDLSLAEARLKELIRR